MKKLFQSVVILLLVPLMSLSAADGARLLRFPAIHGDQIVFSYAGDLYSVNSNGGIARQLTSHPGYEMFPRFSPDGTQIAFTGQYDGNTEVFLIPAEGGSPKRLTYTATLGRDDVSDRMGPNNIVMDWTPDGQYISFRSRKDSYNSFIGALYKVPVEGGLSEELPLPYGGFHSWSPDGTKLAYNRIFREFRTWKYYRGGMADEIWIHDFNTRETRKITDNTAQDIIPMWAGDEIYFLSDRDRTMNVFVYNLTTGETSKVTDFTDFDVKFPSLGDRFIVFENGGYIYKLDTGSKEVKKVNIEIANDQPFSRTELKDASKQITAFDLSPNGERVLFSARGEVFTVPSKKGITWNLTESAGANDRLATWSPDGRYIAWFSDLSGEYELYMQNQDRTEAPVQLTHGYNNYPSDLKWSPDSKKLLFSGRGLRLQFVDIESKKTTLVKKSVRDELNDFGWSPDSKWIAYSEPDDNGFYVIQLFNLESGETTKATDNWYHSREPRFSPDGKYLYFVSLRDFHPTRSNVELNFAFTDMSKVYLITLAKDTPSPFAPENDEVKIEADSSNGDDAKGEKGKKEEQADEKGSVETEVTRIDTEGLNDRIIALSIQPKNYGNLYPVNGGVYYTVRGEGISGSAAKWFDLENQKETDLGSNVAFTLSANQKKMLVRMEGKYGVIDLPKAQISITDPVDVSDMKVMTDYRKEWQQIYDEAWRQMRDFFYVENMHGLDWKAMHDKYEVLVPYVNNRDDLTYIIGELVGELSVGHAYVNSPPSGGVPERIQMGLLGAKLSKDDGGYFRIDEILRGANWSNDLRSPLTEVGVNISEGDFITAVNGKSTKEMDDIYKALVNTAGKTVQLTISPDASGGETHDELVKPISDESGLYYYDWVRGNIEKVNEATDGQIGYIHIPDMGIPGLQEFTKYYYPQLLNKKGLIIDDRGNGGGFVSRTIIERLRRELSFVFYVRGVDQPNPVPDGTVYGPKVMLINYASASDGDLFPYQFKKQKLGTLIGTRTWGGVVGIRGAFQFVDDGTLTRPESGSHSSEKSEWIIENHGVEPDITVDNDPSKEYEGIDQQLNKAIEVIMSQLDQYAPPPPRAPAPDKSGN
ncbi:MAG: S41 family peptidase [Bacteroidales bacterium]